jgi:NAD(P)-dependent dehydrogenase (short-subunit alcohol dehydrogenase family)
MTDVLSREVSEYGVAVFAINPGLVRTDMTAYIVESEEGQRWRPDVAKWFEEGGDRPPELTGRFIAFLVSGRANALAGRFLDVEDDLTDLVNHAEDIEREDRYALRWRR